MKTINSAKKTVQLGNTKPTANEQEKPIVKKQCNAGIRWCFTFHKYTQKDIETINSANSAGIIKFIIFSEELGKEKKTPHLQGYLEFSKKNRPSSLSEYFPNTVHWEVAKGNRDQNERYISKEDGNCWKNGKLMRKVKILKENEMWIWETELLKIINVEPDDRTIHWYWEENGNSGKSTFTKYLVAKHKAITLSSKTGDMKYGIISYKETSGDYPDIIIIDIPRSVDLDYLSYTGIEEIKNGCFFSSKYESKQVIMPNPHIIIFSNEEPNVNKMSKDRWKIHEIQKWECKVNTVKNEFLLEFT